MSATLISLAHTTSRILDAQQAQFAADAAAISCVLVEQTSAHQIAQLIAEQNNASILQIDFVDGRCVAVVQSRVVVRQAVAVSTNRLNLPTLK